VKRRRGFPRWQSKTMALEELQEWISCVAFAKGRFGNPYLRDLVAESLNSVRMPALAGSHRADSPAVCPYLRLRRWLCASDTTTTTSPVTVARVFAASKRLRPRRRASRPVRFGDAVRHGRDARATMGAVPRCTGGGWHDELCIAVGAVLR
jgi:hypothetical protein